MDYSNKGGLSPNAENPYYRKTSVSRSIKQNGEFLFSTPRRRMCITPYIPPHRRKDSIDDGSLNSKRSEEKDRTSVQVFDQSNGLKFTENNFKQEFNEKSIITQEINTKSIIKQESNHESITEQFNHENIKQRFNQEYATQGINQKSFTEEFNQESLRQRIDQKNINQGGLRPRFNQERITQESNQDLGQKNNRENVIQKSNGMNIVEKVLKLAKHYMNFEFKKTLCDIYFDKYKEKLPSECLNAIKFCISLDLDDRINDFLNAESHIEQNHQEGKFLKNKEDNSLFCQKEISKPEVLELKDVGEEFWILICNCDSFINIWGVIMDADHFGKVEELANEMKIFYQFESKIQKVKVEENSYYALFDGSWHRVQCIKCNGSTAEVFFIDRGDRDNVSIDRLFKLDPKFFKLPAQAINMRLSDLEIFTDCDGTHEMLDELLFEKAVYVIVKDLNEEKNSCLSVQLYKTEANETINVNELLMKKLFETVLNPLYYIREDNPEHIEFLQTNETGLFIQLDTKSLKYFKLLMEVLIKKYCWDENLKKQKVVRFEDNKIYFIKRSRDNKFYRARVLKFKNENIIEVLLIDSGIVTHINREDFFSLEKLSKVLAQYPAQAIEVQLDQITVLHSRILDHLHALTSNSSELYVKFLKSENNNIPIIRLFKKVHGYLISVNDAILIEHNDILEETPKISKNKQKLIEGNFDKSKSRSAEGNFNEYKPKSTKGNLEHNDILKDTPKISENKQKLAEGNFDERKSRLAEGNFDEIKQKSAEMNFGEKKSRLAEGNFDEIKQKSAEINFGEKKSRLAEDNFDETKQKSAEGNFGERKSRLTEDNFEETKQKSSEGNFDEIKPKSAEGNFDEVFKNSFFTELERIKLYESELARPIEEVDCTKFCISGLLSPPAVSKGCYFDVHVTIAKDPSCFVIQLLKNKSVELKKMVHEMKMNAVNYRGPKLTYKSINVGQMYAYKCELNPEMWYRVYVLKIKDRNVAHVYYCDYGYYKDVNIANLICLQNQFYSLPYQAICAELYGVKPVSGQFWTAEVCSRFKKLIESKNFVCRVKSIKDVKVMNRSKTVPVTVETIYVVKLIDTSTDEDLYIADILINDGQALKKNGV